MGSCGLAGRGRDRKRPEPGVPDKERPFFVITQEYLEDILALGQCGLVVTVLLQLKRIIFRLDPFFFQA